MEGSDGLKGWWRLVSQTVDPAGGHVCRRWRGILLCEQCVVFQMGRRLRRGLRQTVKLGMMSGGGLQTLEGHSNLCQCVVFSRWDEGCVGVDDKTVKVWDVTSGERLQTLEGHYEQMFSVSFSPDGRRLRRGLMTVGEAVGCDEWGVSAEAVGAFCNWGECVVFSRWDEGCVGV